MTQKSWANLNDELTKALGLPQARRDANSAVAAYANKDLVRFANP